MTKQGTHKVIGAGFNICYDDPMAEQSLSDLLKEQEASWEKLRKRHEEANAKFMLEFEQKMEKQDKGMEEARRISRDTVPKIVALSTTILGFSVTLLSIDQINLKVSTLGIKTAWVLLTITIALGLIMPYLESRAKYIIYWRSIQDQEWDRKIGAWDKFKVILTIVYSLLIGPRNLIYCKIYNDDAVRSKNAHKNAQVIHWTNKVINLSLALESVFVAIFVAAMFSLLLSVEF